MNDWCVDSPVWSWLYYYLRHGKNDDALALIIRWLYYTCKQEE